MENAIMLIRCAVDEERYSEHGTAKSIDDVGKVISKYKFVDVYTIEGQRRVRALPADLPITLNELIDYMQDRAEEFVVYDYSSGEYTWLSNEYGIRGLSLGFSLEDGDKEKVRKALQETL